MTKQAEAPCERDPAAQEAAIAARMERELDCSDVSIKRMHRWRPIYEAEAVRNGKRERYFLKGERTWPTHPYPLKYECDMQRALWESGIRVPEIVAWIPDPATIVMEWVDGGRDAGLIQQAIERLMTGRTTLVIAHRLSTVRALDRILVFDKGRIVEEGDHMALIRRESGIYRRLFEKQALELTKGLVA